MDQETSPSLALTQTFLDGTTFANNPLNLLTYRREFWHELRSREKGSRDALLPALAGLLRREQGHEWPAFT